MSLLADCRSVARRTAKAPGFALAAVLMLSLGIAVSTAMTGVVRGLLGSMPFPDAGSLLVVNSSNAKQQAAGGGLTPQEALHLDRDSKPFASFGYYNWGGLTLFADDRARELTIAQVSAGFFPTFGMPALRGRWFSAAEFSAEANTVILSYAEWQRQFGGADSAIGQSIDSSAGRLRVVGIMPPQFAMPSSTIGAWRPSLRSAFALDQPWVWSARFLNGVARLPPGQSLAAANKQLAAVGDALASSASLPTGEWQIAGQPLLDTIVGDLRGVLWGALTIALLVLLIGCANVAILVDARQVECAAEQALRQALGASRTRLLRTALLEIGLISILSVVLGIGLALLGIESLRELARGSLPRVNAIAIDPGALWIAAGLSLLLPLVVALAGSLRLRAAPSDAMRGGGAGKGIVGSGSASRRLLPILGIALSTVSLVAGSALVLSLLRLAEVDPGFRSQHVYALQLFRDGDEAAYASFVDAMRQRLAAVPGVRDVALTSAAPLAVIGSFKGDIAVAGRNLPEPFQVGIRRVDAGFLPLLAVPVRSGRGITIDDRAGAERVTVINQTLARRLFGDASPLGQVLMLSLSGERLPHRIVGVSGDIRNSGLRALPGPELLIGFALAPTQGMTFLVRSDQALANVEALLTQALFDVDKREASTAIFSLANNLKSELQSARFFARTMGAFALAALVLAAFGVYAVAALAQRRRVAEFGLRLAVGAKPRTLAWEILRDSARTVCLGIVLGLGASWGVLRWLAAQLYGVDASSPSVLVLGVGMLVCAAFVAALLPALRAAKTDPMQALRMS